MNDFELLLIDRIEKIKSIDKQYDIQNNGYIAFSGGKDSTILHYLIDLALPNNSIPRVFINTGIEYCEIVKFVKDLARKDSRIIIYNVGVNIKQMLEKEGYPFKSKEHSLKVNQYKKGHRTNYLLKYKNGVNSFSCPKKLQYQFDDNFKLNISNKCCYKLKKEPIKEWENKNNKKIKLTGMRKEEGGNRKNLNCIITDKKGNLLNFHPLVVMNDEWEEWFIKKYNIVLCKLYSAPYNFIRTGCKGCPFNLKLQKDLETLKNLLPNEYKQCEIIWKPVYQEYRRIGYRLKKEE